VDIEKFGKSERNYLRKKYKIPKYNTKTLNIIHIIFYPDEVSSLVKSA